MIENLYNDKALSIVLKALVHWRPFRNIEFKMAFKKFVNYLELTNSLQRDFTAMGEKFRYTGRDCVWNCRLIFVVPH